MGGSKKKKKKYTRGCDKGVIEWRKKTNVNTIKIFLIELQRSLVVKVELNC